ncbi:MAG: carboxylesterase/lipase family protein [Steroidobacteraceae bacterium]
MPKLIGRVRALLVLAGVATCATLAAESSDPLRVDTDTGVLRGSQGKGVREFKGIPFASPPTGALRFSPPVPQTRWAGMLDATRYKSPCPQVSRYGQTDASDNEDCLYLNITVPAARAAGRGAQHGRPVIVWIPGGAYVGGSADIYPLDYFSRSGDVVIVSINYRLGAFGFMAHPAFDPAHNGSLGLEDQREALRWVKRNIGAFGGDAHNVTLAGESAGAASVCMQLIAPHEATGLFEKAIIQSIGCTIQLRSAEEAVQTGVKIARLVHCTDPATAVACLREKSVHELLEAQVTVGGTDLRAFGLGVGSISVPREGAEAFATGQFVKVPMINGGNSDEMGLYVAYEIQAGGAITRDNYVQRLRASYGENAVEVARRYPLSADLSAADAVGRAESDFMPGGPLNNCLYLETARLASRFVPVYEFEFADPGAPSVMPKPGLETGAVHSAELLYFYPHISFNSRIDGPDLPPRSQPLSHQMIAYWSQFARTGHPSVRGLAAWPAYRSPRDVMRLEPGHVGTFDAAQAHQCRFWRELYPAALGSNSSDAR